MPSDSPAAPRSAFLVVFPTIMLPMFLAALDQTIVSTALPAMASTLGDVERVSWVVVSYLLANTIAAPVCGRLGDALRPAVVGGDPRHAARHVERAEAQADA